MTFKGGIAVPSSFSGLLDKSPAVVKARRSEASLGLVPRFGVHRLPICETPPSCGLPRRRDHISASPTHLDVALLSFVGRTGSAGVPVFFRGDCSIDNCSFHMSVGGGEFRIFLRHHPEPTSCPLFLSAFNTC